MLFSLIGWGILELLPKESTTQKIILPFYNANEITVGSAVRMMGLNIGYVKSVMVRRSHVDVTIVVTSKSLRVPNGAEATVLFTGLAGSKSVEFDLPTESTRQSNGIFVKNPITLRDVLNSQLQVAIALEGGAQNINNLLSGENSLDVAQRNIKGVENMTQGFLPILSQSNQIMRDSQARMSGFTKNAKAMCGTFSQASQPLFQALSSVDFKRTFIKRLAQNQKYIQSSAQKFQQIQSNRPFRKINRQIAQVSNGEAFWLRRVQNFSITPWADRFNATLWQFDRMATNAYNIVTNPHFAHSLQTVRKKIRQINHALIQANQFLK